jgi:hypothetical protein
MRADVGGESAAMTDDGRLHVRAKVMVSRKALVTVHVATRVPADADRLSDLARLGIWTDSRDPSTISWPRIAGYCEMPQSLFKTDKSE